MVLSPTDSWTPTLIALWAFCVFPILEISGFIRVELRALGKGSILGFGVSGRGSGRVYQGMAEEALG